MRSLTATELLNIWETGRHVSPSRRSLLLLSAAFPEEREVLADIPLGGVCRRLLQLRALLFGPTLNCLAGCPACRGTIETSVEVDELLGQDRHDQNTLDASVEPKPYAIVHGDYSVEFRLPTARDVMALDGTKVQAVSKLAELLIISSTCMGEQVAVGNLPEGILAAVEHQVTDLDPLAQIELALSCPDCAATWEENLHIIDFLWQEIGNLARRLLFEVARLAATFGWSEQDILNLSPERRRSYLELLGA